MFSTIWTFLLVSALLLGTLTPAAAGQSRAVIVVANQRGHEAEGRDVPRVEPRRPGFPNARPVRPQDRRGAYEEPAFARGYSDGFMRGTGDGRNRDRYDPVGHRDYRSGDQGYYRDYGSRDAYKNNYRAGFRQGYDAGYRNSARGRR